MWSAAYYAGVKHALDTLGLSSVEDLTDAINEMAEADAHPHRPRVREVTPAEKPIAWGPVNNVDAYPAHLGVNQDVNTTGGYSGV